MLKKVITLSALSLVVMSGAAQAIEGSVDVSRKSTNLELGLGSNTPGLFLNGNWLRSNDDGKAFGLGLGYNVDAGALRVSPTVKALYTHPENGKDGYATAVGAGAHYALNDMWGVYGEYYYAPEAFNSNLANYKEIGGGLSFTPVSLVNLRAGYQYIEMKNQDGRKDNVLVDGFTLGGSLRF
ncbi:YfaZ family outer membrane protein [Siccibacter turicensis]|uniref:Porin n=1 Tax=Siccibacter turicensis TaxID=357233 RepID=A0A2P8VGZ8_9ENTR|nr:YfaZ family outer membrane protein [Siccibacter turicensis]PSN06782.1 porin [Siccibacter turicensis]